MKKGFKSKYISVLLASVLVTQSISTISFAFNDTQDHWAKNNIDKLSSEEILKGYDDGTFGPDKYISREEAAAVIERTIKSRKVKTNDTSENISLSDIEGRWSTESIKFLVSKGIIEGYPGGKFVPEGKITRQEAVKIVSGIINPEAKEKTKIDFSDINNQWGKDLINRLAGLGLINGYGDNIFEPNNNITRAELAKIISELLDREKELLVTDKLVDSDKPITPDKPSKPEEPNKPVEPDTPSTPGGGTTVKPDFSELDKAIKKAEDADLSDKTSQSKAKLEEELNKAKKVRSNSKAKKSEIEKATKDLNDAIDGLKTNALPTISAEDKLLVIGSNVNLLEGVSANDEEDGDLTSEIKVAGEVPQSEGKANKTGEYTIKYSVTDSEGKTTEKSVKIRVVSNDKSGLKLAIENAENIDTSGKTEDTVNALKEAIRKAKLVNEDLDVTIKEITNAIEDLLSAVDGLEDKKSSNTDIKLKDSAKVGISVDNEKDQIDVYSHKEDGTPVKYSELISELDSLDGSKQTYKSIESGFLGDKDLDPSTEIKTGTKIIVTSEDGKETVKYTVFPTLREQTPPTGLTTDPESASGLGKIKNVNDAMEWRPKVGTTWTAIEGTEISDLKAGEYIVRYKAKPGYSESTSTSVMVEEVLSDNTDIKLKDSPKIASMILDFDGIEILTYSHFNNGEHAKYSDLLNDIISADGSNQSYRVLESDKPDSKEIPADSLIRNEKVYFEIKSESGKSINQALIAIALRNQSAPTGLESEPESASSLGKIKNVDESMEWKKVGGITWSPVNGNEITGVSQGSYLVRYKSKLGFKESPTTMVTVDKALSSVTDIKLKDSAKVGISVDNTKDQIDVYSHKEDGTPVKYSELISELDSLDGSKQTYKSIESGFLGDKDLDPSTEIKTGTKIVVTSEDGKETAKYTVFPTLREQTAPTGLTSEPGKIKNVTDAMEWRPKVGTTWTTVEGTEISDLKAGEYLVRYKAKPGYSESTTTSVVVEENLSANTVIKLKENNDVTVSVDSEGAVLRVYRVKADGEKATFDNIISELESEDGSNQTYEVRSTSGSFTPGHLMITTGYELHVTSERGNTRVYEIKPIKRQRQAPEGLVAVDKTPTEGGKILNVDSSMQYKLSTGDAYSWKEIKGTEITGLEAGSYDIRYMANVDYTLSPATTIEVKQSASNVTSIAKVDGATTIDKIVASTNKIFLYKTNEDGSAITYSDVLSELKSTDGSVQTYKVLEAWKDAEKPVSASPVKYERIKVIAEDETEQIYTIDISLKPLAPPTGLVAHHKTATSLGKITGVNSDMQYIQKDPDNPTFWVDIASGQTEIKDLEPGEYEVRDRKTANNAASSSVILIIEDKSTEEPAPEMPEEIVLEINPEYPGIIDGIDLEYAFIFEGKTPADIKKALIVVGDPNAEIKVMDSGYNNKLEKDNSDPIQSGDNLVIKRSDGKTAVIFISET